MYSYEPFPLGNRGFWILDPFGVTICPVECEGHAVVLVDHLNRKA